MANIVDPSTKLQDYAIGCDNPNAPPPPGGGGGDIGGGGPPASGPDVDPFIFDSVLTGTPTSADGSIDYRLLNVHSSSDVNVNADENVAVDAIGSIAISADSDISIRSAGLIGDNQGTIHLEASSDILVSAGATEGGSIYLTTNGSITHASTHFEVEAHDITLAIADINPPTFFNAVQGITPGTGGPTSTGTIEIVTGQGGLIDIDAGRVAINATGDLNISTNSGDMLISPGGSMTLLDGFGNGITSGVSAFSFDGTSMNIFASDVLELGAGGTLKITTLPDHDPHVVNALYAVSGFVRISGG